MLSTDVHAAAGATRGEQPPSCGTREKPRWQQQQIFPLGEAAPRTPALASSPARGEELLCKSTPSGLPNRCPRRRADHNALHAEVTAFFLQNILLVFQRGERTGGICPFPQMLGHRLTCTGIFGVRITKGRTGRCNTAFPVCKSMSILLHMDISLFNVFHLFFF